MCPALVLAAGRGERMRPLTDHTPKPLLPLHGRPLMGWTLAALLRDGVRDLTVNTAWLGEQVARFCRAREGWPADARLHLSEEGRDFGRALETAGGIARACPWREDTLCWVVAGDVHLPDFRFEAEAVARFRAGDDLAHLWLVPNPSHHPGGDFGLDAEGRVHNEGTPRFTYSTVALLRRSLFEPPWCDLPPGNPQGVAAPLAPLLRRAAAAGRVGGSLHLGRWTDVGTPQRLAALERGD